MNVSDEIIIYNNMIYGDYTFVKTLSPTVNVLPEIE